MIWIPHRAFRWISNDEPHHKTAIKSPASRPRGGIRLKRWNWGISILQAVIKYPELQKNSLVELLAHLNELPADIRTTLQNNGGGHLNHALFWEYMAPHGVGEPQGKLAEVMTTTFGSFAKFKEQFDTAAKNRLGSGWAWLSVTPAGDLETSSTANQDTPLSHGHLSILCLDVWEHAYYLKYHNKRAEYVTNWWHVVNWNKVQERFETITR